MRGAAALIASLALGACGGGDYRPGGPERHDGPPLADGRGAADGHAHREVAPPPGSPESAGASASEPAGAVPRDDAPEISRSVGDAATVVVLWPRIVMPRGASGPDDAARRAAREVQGHLAALVGRALPGRKVDVRPEPERVCPRPGGCRGVSVGAVVARAGDHGCTVLALVAASGERPVQRFAWAGGVTMSSGEVGFREPPEVGVRFGDMARCDGLAGPAEARSEAVTRAIRDAAGSG